jgi:hypothetical protein
MTKKLTKAILDRFISDDENSTLNEQNLARDLLEAVNVIEAIRKHQVLIGAGGPVLQSVTWKLANEYLEGR